MRNDKEIMTLYSNVLLELYDENPYEQHVSETGLKLTDGKFENPDSGELDKKDFYTDVAKVIEAGPMCKYTRKDDEVVVDIRTLKPIRFMGNVYFVTAEQNLMAVINDDLSTRFMNLN